MLRAMTPAGCLLAATALFAVGCQESTTYETQKPVIEEPAEPADESLEETTEEMAEEADEAASDAADAVTPDRERVDVDSPIGDVNVDEDPATGETKVDVDAGAQE